MAKSHKYPCGICQRNIYKNQKWLLCNQCNFYVHISCNKTSAAEYEALQKNPDEVPWFCLSCTVSNHESILPFGSVENEVLSNIFYFDIPSAVDSLPSFEVTSHLTDLPDLQDYDVDEHLPSNISSSYHTIQKLSSSDITDKDLSFRHMNVRSLSCHIEELQSLLVNLNINFDAIGVSETWDSVDGPTCTKKYSWLLLHL